MIYLVQAFSIKDEDTKKSIEVTKIKKYIKKKCFLLEK